MNDDLAKAKDVFNESASAWTESTQNMRMAEGLAHLTDYLEQIDQRLQRLEDKLGELDAETDSDSTG